VPSAEQNTLESNLLRDWLKLIRKLRWIGIDEDASRLQQVACRLLPDERGTVSAGPLSTD
jgi:hypothetical protein